MKKALVLGVLAIFAISMNVTAQERTTAPEKKESKPKPAATIKTTEKKNDTKAVEIQKEDQKKAELTKEEQKKAAELKAVDPKGNNDARNNEIKEAKKEAKKAALSTSSPVEKEKKNAIKKESKNAGMGGAVGTKEVGKTNLKKAPAADKKESLKPKTIKKQKETPKNSAQGKTNR